MKNKILWFCGPIEYLNSGISNYSKLYIEGLKNNYEIKTYYTFFQAKSLFRIIWNFIYIPLLSIFNNKITKIYYDEGWLPILIYPIRNSIFIIHDVRDFTLTNSNPSLLERIYFNFIKKSFLKLNSKKVKKVITPSKFTKDKLVGIGIKSDKIEVIYNGVNESYIKKYNKDSNLRSQLFKRFLIPSENIDKKIILNIGTEEDRKNIITILKSLKYLDNYIFIKIGNPIIEYNRKYNLEYVKNNNLNVYFIDSLGINDIIDFYNIADLYLNTSLFEGFGRTVLEAQACGCPVLSTYNSGLIEVLGKIDIFIVNPLDEFEISNKINFILNDNEISEKLSSFGISNSKRFLINENISKWYNII